MSGSWLVRLSDYPIDTMNERHLLSMARALPCASGRCFLLGTWFDRTQASVIQLPADWRQRMLMPIHV